ncbi:MAG: Na/Pi symporter [Opitutia bacterium]|jgi:phosphate:Na+ symporter
MDWLPSILAFVMLYLHGLRSFSQEVTQLGGRGLSAFLRKVTSSDIGGAAAGAVSAALVQSSAAVNAVALGLSHGGSLTPRAAWSIMVGTNVGTTLTAWLVAFKVAGLGAVFLTAGGLGSLYGPSRLRTRARALFYFGLIFLALDLISSTLRPLASHPGVAEWRTLVDAPLPALLFGIALTVVVQSSSVVVGLTVIAVSQGLMNPLDSLWVVVGANLGTTSSAVIASLALGAAERRVARLNVAMELVGVAIFAAAIWPLAPLILGLVEDPGRQVALAHTLYNVACAVATLALLPRIWPRLRADSGD